MLLKTAQDIHSAGRPQAAIPLYEQVLASDPRSYGANYLLGIALFQVGQPDRGIRFLKTATEINPDAPEAQRDLGIILLKLRDYGAAEVALAQAARLDPGNPQPLVNRGIALKNLGRAEEAALCQRAALVLKPDFAEAHHHLGNALLALARPGEALDAFQRATTLKPGLAEAWQGTGQAYLDLGKPSDAILALGEAVRLNPAVADVHRALGIALLREERGEEALQAITGALAIDPDNAGALVARGSALELLKRNDQALAAYGEALRADPRNIEALLGQAGLLRKLRSLDEALAAYDRAIALAPERGDAYYGVGMVFMQKREFAAAARSLDEAAKYMPGAVSVHHQRAKALKELDRTSEAIAALDSAIAADATHVDSYLLKARLLSGLRRWDESLAVLEAVRLFDTEKDHGLGQRFNDKMQACDWSSYYEDIQRLTDRLTSADGDAGSFNLLAYIDDPALQRRCAEADTIDLRDDGLASTGLNTVRPDGKITIAYVGADFRDHATMFLLADVFEHHDRGRFRILAFSLREDKDSEMRKRVEPFFDAFHDLDAMTDREIIALARQEEVEIAVDLMGFTRYGRPSLFAARMAPLQVSYLAYAGTTGLRSMDYFIADPVTVPERSREHFTEKIACLPDSYEPNDRKRLIAEGVPTRAALGLPEEAFVFCCFNNSFKITPPVFDSWMRILDRTPGSVLWLFSYAPLVERNLREAARQRGIDPQRLVFAQQLPLPEHLARHRAADLFLDTLPYNAHTTASDALWAGLPVLTLMGETFASRVAGSLLTATGLAELIAPSRAEYERMAIGFYADRQALQAVRDKLAANRLTCALFDPQRYTRNLETLFASMVARQRAGLPPDHLHT